MLIQFLEIYIIALIAVYKILRSKYSIGEHLWDEEMTIVWGLLIFELGIVAAASYKLESLSFKKDVVPLLVFGGLFIIVLSTVSAFWQHQKDIVRAQGGWERQVIDGWHYAFSKLEVIGKIFLVALITLISATSLVVLVYGFDGLHFIVSSKDSHPHILIQANRLIFFVSLGTLGLASAIILVGMIFYQMTTSKK